VDRLERLVNLVVALLDTRRPLTREELRLRVGGYAEDVDNFRRNFERDKELLRQMGIPLVTEPVDPRQPDSAIGYRVPRDLYELPDPGLEDDELMALGLAASAVAFEGAAQGAATTALWKLTAASRASASPSGPSLPAPAVVPVVDVAVDPTVALLFSAVAEKRGAHFAYNGVARHVDPYRLSYRQGRWYLAGFDHARQAERLFRVDRIDGVVEVDVVPGSFERPEGAPAGPPPPWRLGDDDEIVVDLRVDPIQAPWVASLAGPVAVAGTEPDGTTYFKLSVTNRSAFRGFVLGLLDHAEVLGPPEVRDEIVEWLCALATPGPAADMESRPPAAGLESRR
jgi:predicted DNA-binding transcriptional regulator YafY